MQRLFFSDVHLSPTRPERTRRLLALLRSRTPGAREIYILGDLFDYWIGPKHLELPDYREALDALRRTTADGVRVVFLKGNRDFYMGGFAEGTGVETAPDGARHEIRAGRQRVLLCHGNYLDCRPRLAHLPEEIIRSHLVESVYTRLPASVAKRGAAFYRRVSGHGARRQRAAVRAAQRLSRRALDALFREGFDVVVCGHFHRPAKYVLKFEGQEKTLFTLGDWTDGSSYLVEENGAWRLFG
jgi:UDP-2,3-diacylglucosamine hydrolase